MVMAISLGSGNSTFAPSGWFRHAWSQLLYAAYYKVDLNLGFSVGFQSEETADEDRGRGNDTGRHKVSRIGVHIF